MDSSTGRLRNLYSSNNFGMRRETDIIDSIIPMSAMQITETGTNTLHQSDESKKPGQKD